MKVALLAPLVTPIKPAQDGGSQAMVADLGLALAERGHETTLFASTGSRVDGVNVVDIGVDSDELARDRFNPAHPHATSAALAAAFQRAFEFIQQFQPDVIHNHAFDPPAVAIAAEMGCPVVHTLHLPPTDEMAAALDSAPTALTKVVVISNDQLSKWEQHTRIDAVIPNGIPLDQIPFNAVKSDFLLFAGRLSPEKGTAQAIDIATAASMKILVAGGEYDADYADNEIRPRLKRANARLLGSIERPELWRLMSQAAAVLCPVMWDEPFGLVAAEAQATGTPVLASRRGALTEIVNEGVSGYFIDPTKPMEAREAVRNAAGLEPKVIRSWAESQFDLGRMVGAYESLYSELAHQGAAGLRKVQTCP